MIPVSEPVLGNREAELVIDCVRSGWISSMGSYLDQFESGWAARCERAYGVAVANGTVALQLALAALDLEAGAEVVMPTFTIMSCALAALYNGCVPVLVDADPETWCMDATVVESAMTPRAAAVMPVHIYGHPVEMRVVLDVARRHQVAVIEDAAEAHGARCDVGVSGQPAWRACGSFGEVSTFSFYANKLITTGEGGMVVTDSAAVASKARSLRNLAFQSGRRFFHEELGFNFRMTNVQAAIGVAQLERFETVLQAKRRLGSLYTELLAGEDRVQLPTEKTWAENVYWMYGIVLRDDVPFDAAELAARLRVLGVETRPFFLGLHEQPVLQGRFRAATAFPVAERLARRGLYLPSGAGMEERQMTFVASALRRALDE